MSRRYERKAARRYRHAVRGDRPCWRFSRRPCLHCLWRVLSGSMARERAAHLARVRQIEARALACEHPHREPSDHPRIEWHCPDCGTSRWNRKASA